MKKLILSFTILFSLFTVTVFAQENLHTTIYLKNGSIVRGKIIKNLQDSIIKFKTGDDNLWVFEYSEIKKFEETTIDKKILYNKKGYIFTIENSMSVDVYKGNTEPEKATGIFIGSGFKYSNRFYTGIVAGVEKWGTTTLPLLIEQHISIYKRNASPFLYIRGGYSFAFEKNNDKTRFSEDKWYGGFTYGVGIGVKIHAGKSFGMYFCLGYRQQRLLHKYNSDIYYRRLPYRIENRYVYNRFAVKIGLFF